jgi:hypothetical protein
MLPSRRWFCSAVLALACGGGVVEAGTITVGNGGITTIQQAIDAALANADTSDTINIPSGIYAESVYISLTGTPTQASLALQRSGKGLVQIVGTSADKNAVRIQDAHGITLKNLTVQSFSAADGDEPAVEIGGVTSNVVLDGVSGVAGDDVGVVVSGTTTAGVLLKKCNFSGMTKVAFSIDGNAHTLDGCVADDVGGNAFLLSGTSTNCLLLNCSSDALTASDVSHPGLFTIRGTGHRLEKCTVKAAASHGFFFDGAAHRAVKCVAQDCDVGFIALGTQVLLESCTSRLNTYGFQGGAEGGLILGGSFSDNTVHGVELTQNGMSVRNATLNSNLGQGIRVTAGVERSALVGNKFKSNGGDAIQVLGDNNWLESNKATGDSFVDLGTQNAGRANKVSGSGLTNDFP